MNCARRFPPNRPYDARMGMSESVDRDSSEEIEVFLSGGVEDVSCATMGKQHFRPLVGRQQILLGFMNGRRTIRPERPAASLLQLGHHAAESAAGTATGSCTMRVPEVAAETGVLTSAAWTAAKSPPGA